MSTISITSNDGALKAASAVLEVTAANPEYNQPTLRIKQAGEYGGAAPIRIDDPDPDIEGDVGRVSVSVTHSRRQERRLITGLRFEETSCACRLGGLWAIALTHPRYLPFIGR